MSESKRKRDKPKSSGTWGIVRGFTSLFGNNLAQLKARLCLRKQGGGGDDVKKRMDLQAILIVSKSFTFFLKTNFKNERDTRDIF